MNLPFKFGSRRLRTNDLEMVFGSSALDSVDSRVTRVRLARGASAALDGFFPIAFAILWYAFLLLYPFTYGGLAPYQNFVDNA